MKTTLNAIRDHEPCPYGWQQLLRHLGKTKTDDEPLSLITVLNSNGLADALWCLRAVEGHEKEIRLYAAAPDLLESCEALLELVEILSPIEGDTHRKAQRAIAKAKGELDD